MPTTAALALAGVQALQASQAKAEALDASAQAANEFASLKEVNKLAALKIPTLGTDLAKQNIEQRTATELNAFQQAGANAVLGGTTALNQQAMQEDLQLAAQANEMQYNRDAMVAQQDQAIEAGRVNRGAALAQSRIAGAGQARAEAQQNFNSALGGAVQTLGAQSMLDAYQNAYQDPNAPKDLPSFMGGKTNDFWGSMFNSLGLGKKVK
jgi:hypothetical protein